jgi:hypothetical protein
LKFDEARTVAESDIIKSIGPAILLESIKSETFLERELDENQLRSEIKSAWQIIDIAKEFHLYSETQLALHKILS